MCTKVKIQVSLFASIILSGFCFAQDSLFAPAVNYRVVAESPAKGGA